MKNTSHLSGVLFFFLLLIVSSQSIRLLSTKHGQEIKLMKITNEGINQTAVEEDSSINELMGLESCQNGDEECNQRRMASEAHLDYIYTQKHKP